MDFATFNILEGVFWILLGLVGAAAYFRVDAKYKKFALVSVAVFILFGLSDFAEISVEESFLDSFSWLLWWKIAGIIGIITVITWYVRLRIS